MAATMVPSATLTSIRRWPWSQVPEPASWSTWAASTSSVQILCLPRKPSPTIPDPGSAQLGGLLGAVLGRGVGPGAGGRGAQGPPAGRERMRPGPRRRGAGRPAGLLAVMGRSSRCWGHRSASRVHVLRRLTSRIAIPARRGGRAGQEPGTQRSGAEWAGSPTKASDCSVIGAREVALRRFDLRGEPGS